MSGSGYRTWTAGEVLTASNMQNYIQDQTTMVFASASARSSALASPSEGMMSYLTNENELQIYNGTSWIAVMPKSSAEANINQNFNANYTTRTAAVSIRTGTTAYVTLMSPSMTISGGSTVLLGFVVSGATTKAAADADTISSNTTTGVGKCRLLVVTGLTAGVNTFTLASRASDNGAVIATPSITVQAVL